MKLLFTYILCFLGSITLIQAQFQERPDPQAQHKGVWGSQKGFAFIDSEFSLSKINAPRAAQQTSSWKAKGWRNEKLQTQLAFWDHKDYKNITLSSSPLISGKNRISQENIALTPITYVLSAIPGKLSVGCGIYSILDSNLVADRIDQQRSFAYNKQETRPLWLSIRIPKDAAAGIYKGQVMATADGKTQVLDYTVEVAAQTLADPTDWTYHLDLWQNPYSVARYHQVKPFTAEHFKILKPHIKLLADAGQKSITTTLIYDPWNGQTYDKYDGMVKWIKTKDGKWRFDYTHFDAWVTFMQDQGIDKFINCYGLIPWNLSFYYFDEATQKTEILKGKPGEAAYETHWSPFLLDFAKHLKEKGWFEKTTIAMDERPMEAMQLAIALIKKADPNFKISLAGSYHKELAMELTDYSITLHEDMDPQLLAARQARGLNTTFYTCCTEIFPNTFTSSGYSEAVWLAWNTVQRGFDGYLRWAYDCWNKDPNQDTRHGTFLAGDTYFVYPDNRSSIRFERLIEGIQDVEKIKVLKQQLKAKNQLAALENLEQMIQKFHNKDIKQDSIPKLVKEAKTLLNSL